ncbi:MAG TPA: phosphoribosylglycinamide formyltransferase [bacterium]|nr:phosphoribosylglycinamide formyltransferase [bacterium]
MANIRIGVLVSGRGSNLQAIIDSIRSRRLDAEIAVVISDVADAPALDRARAAGIEARYVTPGPKRSRLSDDAEAEIISILDGADVGLVALAGFMRILSPAFVRHFRHRIVNIHPALLPSFPGLHVQKQALDYGVKFSGCTVHFVNEGVDTGPIIIQAAVPVLDDDTEQSLSERILREEHRIYTEAIKLFAEGRLKIDGRRVTVLPR